MRIFLASLTLLCCTFTAANAQDETFFNGKDLTGWKGLPEHWSVKEGVLIGTTKPNGINFNTFLCSEKEFGDFELSLQVKLIGPTANSGIQIRSKIDNKEKYVVAGPQCDMGQQYWGSLYGELFGGMMKASPADLVEKVVKTEDFNDYYILCQGKHVTIKINSTTMVDADFDKLPPKGIIAFQLHGGKPMEAQFKNIHFKELK